MGFKKKVIILFTIIFMVLIHMETTKAAFTVSASATYDANTGVLVIYDAQFTRRSNASLDQMRIGNVTLAGGYEFTDGSLKIYLRNKEEVNQQNGFHANANASLYMNYGAIKRIYTPPGGINVDLVSDSNEAVVGVSVTLLRPTISVQSFTSNLTSISSKGGNILLSVSGNNLNQANLKVYNSYNSTFSPLSASSNTASTTIWISENSMATLRTDVFTLYINDQPSYYSININVEPLKVENKKTEKTSDKKEVEKDKEKDKKKDEDKKDKSNKEEEGNTKIDPKTGKKDVKQSKREVKTSQKNKTNIDLYIIGLSVAIIAAGFAIGAYIKKKDKK